MRMGSTPSKLDVDERADCSDGLDFRDEKVSKHVSCEAFRRWNPRPKRHTCRVVSWAQLAANQLRKRALPGCLQARSALNFEAGNWQDPDGWLCSPRSNHAWRMASTRSEPATDQRTRLSGASTRRLWSPICMHVFHRYHNQHAVGHLLFEAVRGRPLVESCMFSGFLNSGMLDATWTLAIRPTGLGSLP